MRWRESQLRPRGKEGDEVGGRRRKERDGRLCQLGSRGRNREGRGTRIRVPAEIAKAGAEKGGGFWG